MIKFDFGGSESTKKALANHTILAFVGKFQGNGRFPQATYAISSFACGKIFTTIYACFQLASLSL